MTMTFELKRKSDSHKQKVLFTASIAKHILRFHLPYLEWFQKQGFEVHVACNGEEKIPFCDKKWDVPFVRSPYSAGHFRAYRELKNIVEKERFDIIHCHTPMASVITRLAARNVRKNGTKVMYTAHGFHFFKGSSAFNWMTYYPVEIILSKYADAIVTINREDYDLIKEKGSDQATYFLIPGVGVESKKFHPVDEKLKNTIRKKNGLSPDDFIATYAAEFIKRKNHDFIINSAQELISKVPEMKILFAGRGELNESLKHKVEKLNLEKHILFLGFRDDIDEVFKMSDIGISASRQEGLGLNLVEVMMCGLPVVATVDRGHKEIVDHGVNGFLFKQNNSDEFNTHINSLASDRNLYQQMSEEAVLKAKKFELSNAVSDMAKIYNQFINRPG